MVKRRIAAIWIEEGGQAITAEEKKQHDEDDEKLGEDAEPVAMKNQEDVFVLILAVEMIFSEVMSHLLKIKYLRKQAVPVHAEK